jgi:hypothetical protein
VLPVQTTQEMVKTIGNIRAVSRSHNARSQPSPLTQQMMSGSVEETADGVMFSQRIPSSKGAVDVRSVWTPHETPCLSRRREPAFWRQLESALDDGAEAKEMSAASRPTARTPGPNRTAR